MLNSSLGHLTIDRVRYIGASWQPSYPLVARIPIFIATSSGLWLRCVSQTGQPYLVLVLICRDSGLVVPTK